MLGLLGGLVAVVMALAAGLPIWMVALLYVGVGNVVLGLSVALQLWADHTRRPPHHRTSAPRRTANLRMAHGH
jgi:hypothetical protein